MENGEDNSPRITYSESCPSARGGPSTSNGGKWPEKRRDRHDYGKKRERSRDVDENDRFCHSKGGRIWQGSRDKYKEPSQQSSQQPIPHFNTRDHTYIANNRHISLPQYNVNMNSQWSVNSVDGMANMQLNQNSAALPSVSGMEMAQTTNAAMNSYAYPGGMPGGSVYRMVGNYGPFGVGNSHHMVGSLLNEVITLTRCILYRNPNTPPPTPRSKPFSCKTLHISGLPKKVNEEILREVFVRCGSISKIQMITNTSCYIRFDNDDLMDNAFCLMDYQMIIDNKNDVDHTGCLHVDYAKDDHIDCQQALDLEDKNLQQRGLARSPSLMHYTEEEAEKLKKKLGNEETFQQALIVLMSWLENGECNKKTSLTFYSMIQTAHTHIRGLMSSKLKYEDEVNKAKLTLKRQVEATLTEFQKIDKVFTTASLQKVWDHFTRNQRKNIDQWKTQIEEAKCDHLDELLKDRVEDEMELCEDDASGGQNSRLKQNHDLLKEEQDNLKRQLEKFKKDKMDFESKAAQDLSRKDHQLQVLKKATQEAENELNDFSKKSMDANENQNNSENCATNTVDMSARHARLLSLISTFLSVHPFGASIDYIFSYLYQIDRSIELRYVETLMRCYPTIFSEISFGVGATLVKRWKYLGFQF